MTEEKNEIEFSAYQVTCAGITYRPPKDQTPSFFSRFFQRIFLGFHWSKVK